MKKRHVLKFTVLLLGMIAATTLGYNTTVFAGSSNLVVDNSSFKEKLDTSLWNALDKRVSVENGKIKFAKDSKKSTTLITKTIAKNTGYHSDIVNAKVTMDLRGISKNQTFAFALGLKSVETQLGSAGNIEVRFTNDGKNTYATVVEVIKSNDIKTIVKKQKISNISDTTVNVSISNESVMEVSVNNDLKSTSKLSGTGEGRIGFLQDGMCEVTIKDVDVVAYQYDRPENTNINEDFENGSININELTAKMVYNTGHYVPFGMQIVEKGNNHVMEYKNMTLAYLGTMYKYSNFEMIFDVVDLQRKNEVDEEGNITVPKNESIAVSFGDEATDYETWGFETSPDAVVLDSSSQVYSMNHGKVAKASDMGYDFANADCTKDFTVKISVIDGQVTVWLKWIDEKEFKEVLKYKVSNTNPLGYIHIWCSGTYNNFCIDNLKITNKDKDANVVKVDFKTAVYDVPEDFEYEKIGYTYRKDEAKEEKTLSPYLAIVPVAVICMLSVVIVLLIQKKRKGQHKHEK